MILNKDVMRKAIDRFGVNGLVDIDSNQEHKKSVKRTGIRTKLPPLNLQPDWH